MDKICSVDGCVRPSVARTYCRPCWKRWRKYGDPTYYAERPRRPVEERFWEKVQTGPGCWLWTASIGTWGYGIFRVSTGESMRRAHRVSWELTYGDIPGDLWVLHHCDNPPCVRPDHLFLGTHVDNVNDRVTKGRSSRLGNGKHGELASWSKITNEQAEEIRTRYAAGGVFQRDLADEYGVNRGTIGKIVRNERRNPEGKPLLNFVHRRNDDRDSQRRATR